MVVPVAPAPPPPPNVVLPPARRVLELLEAGHLPEWWEAHPPLIVFSGCCWSATGGGQRPVQLARQWAAQGRQVLYISHVAQKFAAHEGIICGNYVVHLPKWLPQLAQWQGDIFCAFPAYYFHTYGRLRHWRMALDICDDWEEFVRIGALQADCWVRSEVEPAFRDAKVVTHSAASLEGFCRRYGARRTLLVPNGGPEVPTQRGGLPADMKVGAGLNVVFCGALWGRWIDWDALERMAQVLLRIDPEAVVHIIGGMDNSGATPKRLKSPNVRCYGERPYPVALRMIAACDVAIIPFRIKKLCEAVDANKWYDYIAGGLPVVCTDVMTDLRGRPYTTLVPPQQLARAVWLAGQQGRIPQAEVQRLTGLHSWGVRAAQVAAALAEAEAERPGPRKSWRRGTEGGAT